MYYMRWMLTLFCLLLLFTTAVSAQIVTNKLSILAVSENGYGDLSGDVASLTLEIIPGRGRVFLDSFPLTKIDTQISTRIAKEIACQFADHDCSQYDFIYTIQANTPLIGGPSAGSAIAAITVATVDGIKLDEGTAITGTMNSGGLVGPVGGVLQKIAAAAENGIHTVLIPRGTRYVENITNRNQTNQTKVDLVKIGTELGISVIEVGSLHDVLFEFSGTVYPTINGSVELPEYYTSTMRMLSEKLCTRSAEMLANLSVTLWPISQNVSLSISQKGVVSNVTNSTYIVKGTSINVNATYNMVVDGLNRSVHALNAGQSYSAASFCYGAGLNIRFLQNLPKNISVLRDEASLRLETIDIDLSNYTTITDLQTYMLVGERIAEAREFFKTAENYYERNNTYAAMQQYVFTLERLESAHAWSIFAQGYGQEFDLDESILSRACEVKIQEAESRKNYMELYVPINDNTARELAESRIHRDNKEYELCLYKASKAKATFDTALQSISTSNVTQLLDEKQKAAQQIILRQSQKGIFPIVGYSYFEYAQALQERDAITALLYYQYAIEMAGVDLYVVPPQKIKNAIEGAKNNSLSCAFAVGIAVGILVSMIFFIMRRNLRNKPKRRNKR
ncbi:MAG: hypothetical protein ACI8Y7_000409 [Candidatus Woesearchaeota archaeon]